MHMHLPRATIGGEEVNQQDVPCSHIETDFNTADQVQQRNQQRGNQAAGHGLRYAELPEKYDNIIDPLTDKQHDDAQCHRHKSAELQNTVIEFHSDH